MQYLYLEIRDCGGKADEQAQRLIQALPISSTLSTLIFDGPDVLNRFDVVKAVVRSLGQGVRYQLRTDARNLDTSKAAFMTDYRILPRVIWRSTEAERPNWDSLSRFIAPIFEVTLSAQDYAYDPASQRLLSIIARERIDPRAVLFPVFETGGLVPGDMLRSAEQTYCRQTALWLNESMMSLVFQSNERRRRAVFKRLPLLKEALIRWGAMLQLGTKSEIGPVSLMPHAAYSSYVENVMRAYVVKLLTHFNYAERIRELMNDSDGEATHAF